MFDELLRRLECGSPARLVKCNSCGWSGPYSKLHATWLKGGPDYDQCCPKCHSIDIKFEEATNEGN